MAATHSFFPVASLPVPHESDLKTPIKLGLSKATSKSSTTRSLNFKANVQNPTKINSTSIKTRDHEILSPSSSSSSSSISFLKQVPDWSKILTPISTIFVENQPEQINEEELDASSGKFIENGLAYRQSFSIRSYEIGADGRISLEALMNHLQETGLNHMKLTGLLGDGLGSTPEMCKRNLIWVATKVQIVIDRYPTWGDDVVVDNWIVASGKNSMRRDSVIRDCKTGQTLIRASSNWVMMNKETRRLSRIPEEVRDEMSAYLMDASPIIEDDTQKLPKLDDNTTDYIVTGLKPRWSDLDINQHVNNAKYIGWILESAPSAIMENHEIFGMTMEYRRECHRDNELQSLTAVCGASVHEFSDLGNVECHHLLRLEDGAEVMRARTEWRPKNACTPGSLRLLAESSS